MIDPSPSRIGVIAVHYHPAHVRRTLDVIFGRVGLLEPVEVVLVANSDAAHAALGAASAHATLLRHDNSGMEFGGFQAGVDHLRRRHADLDWILFVNDTVANTDNYSPQYHRKIASALSRRSDTATIVGRVDAISRSYAIDGCRTHRWVRTNLFALNRPALEALDHRVHDIEADALIRTMSTLGEFFDPDMDPVLFDHLATFLFHVRSGWHWYGAEPLTEQNAARMARKARSIVQEKYLAAKLDQRAADFSDIKDMTLVQKTLRKLDDMRFERMRKFR